MPLSGTITPAGNKNGALPILAACLLTNDEVLLRNVPRISDVEAMVKLLELLGARVEWVGPSEVLVDSSTVDTTERRPSDGGADPRLVPAGRPAAGPVRHRRDAAARRRCHRPPPARSPSGRLPHPGRDRRRPPRRDRAHRAAAGAEPVRLPDGRAVGDGDRERADGGGADPRHHRDPQRRLRAPRPGPGADARAHGRRDRRHRLQRDDRARRRPACAAAPTRSRPITSRSARSWRSPASPAASSWSRTRAPRTCG